MMKLLYFSLPYVFNITCQEGFKYSNAQNIYYKDPSNDQVCTFMRTIPADQQLIRKECSADEVCQQWGRNEWYFVVGCVHAHQTPQWLADLQLTYSDRNCQDRLSITFCAQDLCTQGGVLQQDGSASVQLMLNLLAGFGGVSAFVSVVSLVVYVVNMVKK